MPHTKRLALGNGVDVTGGEANAQLDLSAYRAVRVSVGNWAFSPAPVSITLAHVDQPNTPNANLPTQLDSFTLAPDEAVSKVYEIPGDVVLFEAQAVPSQTTGVKVFFTVYAWTE